MVTENAHHAQKRYGTPRFWASGGLALAAMLGLGSPARAVEFAEAQIFIEYNSSANDLGFHVRLDAEDWKAVKIAKPNGATIMEITPKGAFGNFGLSELFFEGAEPSLDEVPLATLLGLFPEGRYKFTGVTVDGLALTSRPRLSHAVPAGPEVSTQVRGDEVVIRWQPVDAPPEGFPDREIEIVGYQVIVGDFQVTLPASSTSVELPEEFTRSLDPGTHGFEVLAIDVSANQTITAGSFVLK